MRRTKLHVEDKVRIIGGFCYTHYLNEVPTEAVITAPLEWPYYPSHGDWAVQTRDGNHCFMVDKSDLELIEEAAAQEEENLVVFGGAPTGFSMPCKDVPMEFGRWPSLPPFDYCAALPVSLDAPLDVFPWSIWTNKKNGEEYMVYEVLPDQTNDRKGQFSVSYYNLKDSGLRYTRDKEEFKLKFDFTRRLLVNMLYLPFETVKHLESLYPPHVFRVKTLSFSRHDPWSNTF